MKKVLIFTVGLLVALGAVGCKSKKERAYEKNSATQKAIVKQILQKNNINPDLSSDLTSKLSLVDRIVVVNFDGSIEQLDLNGMELTTIPPQIGLLTGLEELDLRNNKLTELPEEIGDLKRLKKLNASINKLVELPEGIGSLESLEELAIGENKIEKIPETIGNLSNLVVLKLYANKITNLPSSMANMKKLVYISLHANPINIFPQILGNLPAGTEITLSDFNLATLPPNVKHETGGMYIVTH